MSRFNTGNHLGSGSPLDLDDNAKNLDVLTNSREALSNPDRFGVQRKTWHGMESEFNADQASREQQFRTFIASSGYQFAGDYAAGIEITQYNQLLRDANGEFWRVSGQVDLPYVTTGAGVPEGDALVSAGDAVLRNEITPSVIEALRRSYAEAGYNLVAGSFEEGGTLANSIDVLLSKASGKAYGWGGAFPKVVAAGSAVVGYVDASSVSEISVPASFVSGMSATQMLAFKEIKFSGETINMSLSPTDQIPNFTGVGTVVVTDIFGNTHECKVENITKKNSKKTTFKQSILNRSSTINIGFVGDSITDGGDALTKLGVPVTGSDLNPTTGDIFTGNLSSTNYMHSTSNGGWNSWAAKFGRQASRLLGVQVNIFNAASSAKNIWSGWQFRNIDYGFFQNAAYHNNVPEFVVICHGMNDVQEQSASAEYEEKIRQIIRKLNFYGAEVMWAIPVALPKNRAHIIDSITNVCDEMNVDLLRCYEYLDKYEAMGDYTFNDLWSDPNGSTDLVHPNNGGHFYLSNIITKHLFDARILNICEGMSVDLSRTMKSTSSGLINFNAEASQAYGRVDVSAGTFSANGDRFVEVFVWSESNVSLGITSIYQNNVTSYEISRESFGLTTSIEIPGRPASVANNKAPYCMQLLHIPYGLSVIRIRVVTLAEGMELPMLHFSRPIAKRQGFDLTTVKSSDYASDISISIANDSFALGSCAPFGAKIRFELYGFADGDFISLTSFRRQLGVELISGNYRLVDLSNGSPIGSLGASGVFWLQQKYDGSYYGASATEITTKLPDDFNISSAMPLILNPKNGSSAKVVAAYRYQNSGVIDYNI